MEEGYLNVDAAAADAGRATSRCSVPAGQAQGAAQQVQFNLTEKGIDFLGYKTLKSLLGQPRQVELRRARHPVPRHRRRGRGRRASRTSSATCSTSTCPATLTNAIAREGLGVPLNLEYGDLMVHQASIAPAAATVLMLDCSHSMILYGEDRFTPAKKVALALTHLIRTQFPGDTLRVVLFHDSAEEIPLSALAHGAGGAVPHQHRRRAQAGAADPARRRRRTCGRSS